MKSAPQIGTICIRKLPKIFKLFLLSLPHLFSGNARFYRSRSKVKSTSRFDHDVAHLHPLTNVPTTYQLPTPYGFPRYSPDKVLQVKVTTARSKVKSRSDHDVAHLHPLTNVSTKYQLPTSYGFRDIAWTRFYRSRSLWQGQIKVRP